MLVMSDENYPGPGVSFGRLDQYLYPYYEISVKQGMTREFMKEILECMWVHCNTAYDAQIKVGEQPRHYRWLWPIVYDKRNGRKRGRFDQRFILFAS